MNTEIDQQYPLSLSRPPIKWPNEVSHIQADIKAGRYIVGLLEGYQADDPTFEDLDLAKIEAVSLSAHPVQSAYAPSYGVWDSESNADCVAIAYEGVLYEPKRNQRLPSRRK